eukprot:5424582-Alexandrium_andersonii.AAC.1
MRDAAPFIDSRYQDRVVGQGATRADGHGPSPGLPSRSRGQVQGRPPMSSRAGGPYGEGPAPPGE